MLESSKEKMKKIGQFMANKDLAFKRSMLVIMISFCVMITQIDISLFNVRNESPLSIEHFHNLSKELQKNLFRVIQAICKWFAYWKREKITAYLSISMRKEALKFCTKVQRMCGFWSAICKGNK